MFYSQSSGGFYRVEIHGDNMPADAVEIPADDYAALLQGQSEGKRILTDAGGFPVLADPAPILFETLRQTEFTKFRADREQFLNRLAGIGLAAQFAGQGDVLASVCAVRVGLLGMTTEASVLAAADLPGLKAAMKARYAAILSGVPAEVMSAFKQVDA